ncbi:hypothetical protein ACQKL5_13165 [Peribacillus sp. NPDC097675]|uniref:hypothetical protein n=1 Tax=Peribacillus sp. NPDC097675 TaxID=3390618 RepID=UPI003CFE1E1A
MNRKGKLGIALTLLVAIGITIYITPELVKKVKSSPLHALYTYNVTKSFTEVSDETVEVASVPMGELKKLDTVDQTDVKIEGASRNIEKVVAESLSEPKKYGGKSTLNGPDQGFKVRKFYHTKQYDKGEYTVTRTNRITGKEKEYTGTYYEPSVQDPFISWSRDYK